MAHASDITFKKTMATALLAVVGLTGCDAAGEGTVGPRGGTVVSDDGRFALEVPAGAVEHELDIVITRVACSNSASVGDCYAVAPEGIIFARPAAVSFELADMPLESLDAERLGLVADKGGRWRPLADREVDLDSEVLTASAGYLSSFAVVELE